MVVVAAAIVLIPGAPLIAFLVGTRALSAVVLLLLLIFIRGLAGDAELMAPGGSSAATAVAIAGLRAYVTALGVLTIAG